MDAKLDRLLARKQPFRAIARLQGDLVAKAQALLAFALITAGLLLAPQALDSLLFGEAVEIRYTFSARFGATAAAKADGSRSAELADAGIRMVCAAPAGADAGETAWQHCELHQSGRMGLFADMMSDPFAALQAQLGGIERRDIRVDVVGQEPFSTGPATWLALLLALWWYRRQPEARCPPLPVAWQTAIGWLLLVAVIDWGVEGLLSPWLLEGNAHYWAEIARGLERTPVRMGLSVVILAPWLEELVFRGLGWRVLARAFPLPWVVVLTTLPFTLTHDYNWAGMLAVTISGFGLAWIRYKSRSVGWCIVLHMLLNAVAFAGFLYFGPLSEGLPAG